MNTNNDKHFKLVMSRYMQGESCRARAFCPERLLQGLMKHIVIDSHKEVICLVCKGEMERNKQRVQQHGGGGGRGGKEATTSLPGRSEQGSAKDQAGVQDNKHQKQVRYTFRVCL